MENVAPIIAAVAALLAAGGGLTLRRRGELAEAEGRRRSAEERCSAAEGRAHHRLMLLRRVEVWLIEHKTLDDPSFPETLRADIEEETQL